MAGKSSKSKKKPKSSKCKSSSSQGAAFGRSSSRSPELSSSGPPPCPDASSSSSSSCRGKGSSQSFILSAETRFRSIYVVKVARRQLSQISKTVEEIIPSLLDVELRDALDTLVYWTKNLETRYQGMDNHLCFRGKPISDDLPVGEDDVITDAQFINSRPNQKISGGICRRGRRGKSSISFTARDQALENIQEDMIAPVLAAIGVAISVLDGLVRSLDELEAEIMIANPLWKWAAMMYRRVISTKMNYESAEELVLRRGIRKNSGAFIWEPADDEDLDRVLNEAKIADILGHFKELHKLRKSLEKL